MAAIIVFKEIAAEIEAFIVPDASYSLEGENQSIMD